MYDYVTVHTILLEYSGAPPASVKLVCDALCQPEAVQHLERLDIANGANHP